MGLFSRQPSNTSSDEKPYATDAQIREIARLVNAGDHKAATKITQSTADPRGAAFEAFRYIDVAPPESS
ncbi:hypothetical protein [Streptacidiphilus carbonis]|uniref:hypothetical protein n=1 Tax=Streptacidiphilus carbonis TaxID=105422 RepID=UPI0005AAD81B|nr:hypothetical protein [Streptacidiphilus carbonis]